MVENLSTTPKIKHEKPLGLILAGGLARRMGGGDKGLKRLAGTPVLDRIIARAEPQCSALILNANGAPERLRAYGLPIAPDTIEGFLGPLAGILAGLDYAAQRHPEAEYMLSLPTDCPFLPADLSEKLSAARAEAQMPFACAASRGEDGDLQTHPVIGLWPLDCRENLRQALVNGQFKIDRFTKTYGITEVEWASRPYDPFFNVNTEADLVLAEAIALRYPQA